MIIKDQSVWRHVKTGNLYRVIFANVLNATNAQNGQRMVVYTREDDPAKTDKYVREIVEFSTRFELVVEPTAMDEDDEP